MRKMKICVKRKIWPETKRISQPTGGGNCGGNHDEAPMRKTYVSIQNIHVSSQSRGIQC